MIHELVRERTLGKPQPLHFVFSHAAGNVEGEDDRQRAWFAGAFFELKERDRLFFAIGNYLEIFLPQVSYGASICIKGRDVDGNEVGIDADHVFGFLLFGKHFARPFGVGRRRRLRLRHAGRSECDQEEEEKGNLRCKSRRFFEHYLFFPVGAVPDYTL